MVDLLAVIDPGRASARADRLIDRFGGAAPALAAEAALLRPLLDDACVALIAAHRRALLWTLREPAMTGPLLTTRYELLDYLRHAMAFEAVESLRALFVNARRELIVEEEVARGGPAAIAVEPRQILVRALALSASGVILIHNHPGGDPVPSPADRRFTQRLAMAGDCLGVRLHDHLIVARGGTQAIEITALSHS